MFRVQTCSTLLEETLPDPLAYLHSLAGILLQYNNIDPYRAQNYEYYRLTIKMF
jgi:hypothetical protein